MLCALDSEASWGRQKPKWYGMVWISIRILECDGIRFEYFVDWIQNGYGYMCWQDIRQILREGDRPDLEGHFIAVIASHGLYGLFQYWTHWWTVKHFWIIMYLKDSHKLIQFSFDTHRWHLGKFLKITRCAQDLWHRWGRQQKTESSLIFFVVCGRKGSLSQVRRVPMHGYCCWIDRFSNPRCFACAFSIFLVFWIRHHNLPIYSPQLFPSIFSQNDRGITTKTSIKTLKYIEYTEWYIYIDRYITAD